MQIPELANCRCARFNAALTSPNPEIQSPSMRAPTANASPPPRGGESDARRIVYQAASGGKVEIKGSEIIKNWEKVRCEVWSVTLPNSFFGSFNPYADLIHGDWFVAKGRKHHTGAVYLNGAWLSEAAQLEEVLKSATPALLWFAEVDGEQTKIWARFGNANPNEEEVEINVRQSVFYPDTIGINYLTVRGFTMRHAATPWAPPTAGREMNAARSQARSKIPPKAGKY